MPLTSFHPATAAWFAKHLGAPTEPQRLGWPAIQAGRHVLIASPTGSGKTLAAFLCAIDALLRQGLEGRLEDRTRVLYVSPLKALSNDIQRNLETPLRGIQDELPPLGLPPVEIRTLVRTGDTPAAERAAMVRRPPHIVVTTPESLYILLTSPRGRAMLSTVRTVIVDEIHAIADDKRGSHLALSLERLEALTAHGSPLQRIGLSATQQPIEAVARFLVGAGGVDGEGRPDCAIVDVGHRRDMDLAIELPSSPLEAVMALEVWEEIYDRLAALIDEHRTTLVFVNTRRLAERVARHLSDRIGADKVTSHHGSLAREQRLDAEQRLKSGQLRALVATASLELGIDIGAVDLVCQLGSTRAISTLLQRVGRSGHHVGGLPKGRLFPLSRDELVEAAALLQAVRLGELDRLHVPEQPLDILAQQIVAAVSAEEWREADLLALARRAWPYRGLGEGEYEAVLRMLGEGFSTRRGRRAALIHRDAVNGRLRERRGARLAAITSGGAIPDIADYEVVLEPEGTFIGTLNEDFAIESMAGDIFQLGNHSWRIVRVEAGKVRVEDARGQPPTIPFWLGEAPGRTDELSIAVSRLREALSGRLASHPAVPRAEPAQVAAREPAPAALPFLAAARSRVPFIVDEAPAEEQGTDSSLLAPHPSPSAMLGAGFGAVREPSPRDRPLHQVERGSLAQRGWGEDEAKPLPSMTEAAAPGKEGSQNALDWLMAATGISVSAAEQIVDYLAAGQAALGVLPTARTIVMERFFDETGGMQLVIHSPLGSRLNRGWGLALRKRFCRKFNFELQAAATEDAIVLSLGQTHSFPLEEVFGYLRAETVRDLLIQALLDAPMFTTRWRWNATRSLAVLRWRNGRKVPAPLQRIQAEDLLAVVFPDQIACAENLVGPRQIPDHPLVSQTIRDCLDEAMDIEGLERLLGAVERGEIRLIARDLPEPSPLAQEILNARPYAFLDDAPLEERRTRAVASRRWLDPQQASEIGALDAAAIARVRGEAWPQVDDADELHDALVLLGFLTGAEGRAGGLGAPREALLEDGRPQPLDWRPLFDRLAGERRAAVLRPAPGGPELWVAAERLPQLRALFPGASLSPAIEPPRAVAAEAWSADQALVELLRGRLEGLGPVTEVELARSAGLGAAAVRAALAALEGEGFVLRGRFTPGAAEIEWCERRLLARIHRYTLNRLRQEIEPISAADFLRFLFEWQGLSREHKPEGVEALAAVLEQLEGFEAPAAAWEAEILPARMHGYDPLWLDGLCLSGRALWARLSPPGPTRNGRSWTPVRATPVALVARRNLSAWSGRDPRNGANAEAMSGHARRIAEWLARRGASFFDDLVEATRLLPTQVEVALGELVSWGLVTSDGFQGLRTLITPSQKRPPLRGGRRIGPVAALGMAQAGRWSRLDLHQPRMPRPEAGPAGGQGAGALPAREEVEILARTLLRRYGVVFRKLLERERGLPPWRDLLYCYRRLEARGEIRGGRFVAGFAGEQFALPEAVGALREVRRKPLAGQWVSISGADPLNLVGIVTPGARLPALAANRVLFRDGRPVAIREAGRVSFLVEVEAQWEAIHALLRRTPPIQMHAYLGRSG
jgi:ATP-dependent Lhr-like helicase